eukprot:1195783-Prorocentrum_minimum.AAC.3
MQLNTQLLHRKKIDVRLILSVVTRTTVLVGWPLQVMSAEEKEEMQERKSKLQLAEAGVADAKAKDEAAKKEAEWAKVEAEVKAELATQLAAHELAAELAADAIDEWPANAANTNYELTDRRLNLSRNQTSMYERPSYTRTNRRANRGVGRGRLQAVLSFDEASSGMVHAATELAAAAAAAAAAETATAASAVALQAMDEEEEGAALEVTESEEEEAEDEEDEEGVAAMYDDDGEEDLEAPRKAGGLAGLFGGIFNNGNEATLNENQPTIDMASGKTYDEDALNEALEGRFGDEDNEATVDMEEEEASAAVSHALSDGSDSELEEEDAREVALTNNNKAVEAEAAAAAANVAAAARAVGANKASESNLMAAAAAGEAAQQGLAAVDVVRISNQTRNRRRASFRTTRLSSRKSE